MADTMEMYEKGKLYQVDLAQLKADPNQPRKFMDPQALDDLTESIKQHNVLMPILFCRGDMMPRGHVPEARRDRNVSPETGIVSPEALYVVAGERRCEAARRAGLATIPGVFVETGNAAEIALVENLLRQDLTPVEEAEALDRLVTEQNYTQDQLGAIIGKARNTVSEILSLNRLPLTIRDDCRSNASVGRKALIEIARKKQERSMITAWNHYKEKLAKETGGPKKRERTPESVEDIMTWLSKALTKLNSIDTSAWTEEEKGTFNETLSMLAASIQGRLNPPKEDNDA